MKKLNIIGSNIKSFRERMGIRQEDLAKFLGIKREIVSYYETGARDIPLMHLNKLADLFRVNLNDLMEEDENLQKANVAFAFRASEFCPADMNIVAEFGKTVKNYIKLKNLCEKYDC